MAEWLAISFILLLAGGMFYRDIKDDKQWREWEEYRATHRHCLPCPYRRK